MVNFDEFLKIWSLRSNSVTRQVNFNWTKIGGKWQNSKIQMRYFGWFSNTVRSVKALLPVMRYSLAKNQFHEYSSITLSRWETLENPFQYLSQKPFNPPSFFSITHSTCHKIGCYSGLSINHWWIEIKQETQEPINLEKSWPYKS